MLLKLNRSKWEMINNEKIKRIGFVLIGIANFILLPFILMYFSGKMTW